MEDLLEKIQEQEKIANQLEIDISNREHLLAHVNEFANEYIESLPAAKAYIDRDAAVENLEIKPETSKSIQQLLRIFKEEVTETGIRASSGGHVGYIPGGGIFAAALGDFLAAISNEYAGVSYASPGAVAIENEVISWLKSVFSFPESAAGNLASGGSISSLIALNAARDKYEIKNEKVTRSVIYLSSQAHHCIKKSLRILGLEDVVLRYVEIDQSYKINPAALERQVKMDKADGLNPFLIIASAGTTDVGAIDPLEEIGRIAQNNNLWFHVDAAYGGFFILTSRKNLFKGMEKADSLVIDPHKGLFLPYGLGAVLVKDAGAMLHSNHYTANYMQDTLSDELIQSPANLSPELTKHFRGLRLWLPLQLHGIAPFIACLEEKLLLVEYFRKQLSAMGFMTGPKPDLSVSYFWYPVERRENEFNKQLMQNIHKDGTVFLSSTLLEGKFVIRIAVLSFRTKKTTIDKALLMIRGSLEKTMKDFNLRG